MGRTLEAIFRRLLQLLGLIVLLPLVGLAVAYFLPRSYQGTATLWALRRYEVIGATGPESNLLSTPAETQATALNELLQSRTFALSVANVTGLSSTLSANIQADPQLRDDTLVDNVSHHVLVTPQAYNLFAVTYDSQSPQVAQQVVQAVIHQFGLQSHTFSVAEGQLLLESYQGELLRAKQNVATQAAIEKKYLLDHNLTVNDLQADPQYGLLHAQTQQAQAIESSIQDTIATLNQSISAQGSGSDALFKVLDAPKIPNQPVSRLKAFLTAGGIGLGIAILACILYLVTAIRRDHSIYAPLELQEMMHVPVVMQLPYLSDTTIPLLTKPPLHAGV